MRMTWGDISYSNLWAFDSIQCHKHPTLELCHDFLPWKRKLVATVTPLIYSLQLPEPQASHPWVGLFQRSGNSDSLRTSLASAWKSSTAWSNWCNTCQVIQPMSAPRIRRYQLLKQSSRKKTSFFQTSVDMKVRKIWRLARLTVLVAGRSSWSKNIQNTTNAQDHATINAALMFFKCVQHNDQRLCLYRMPRSQRHHTDANDCTAAPLKITQVLLQLPPQWFIHHNFLQLDRQDVSFAQGTGSGQNPLSC